VEYRKEREMASLQAKHSRMCATGRAWTPFQVAAEGCTCPQGPLYYVVVRDGARADKIRVGRNRRQAERALRKIAVTVDEGDYQPQPNIAFSEWADRWLASLERRATTIRSYGPTITYAKQAFLRKPVRRLRTEDVARFNRLLRERRMSPSTRAKHLRVLGACLQSAVRHGYAARNPVRDLPPAEKPRPEPKEAAYFENDELPRLFGEVTEGIVKTLFLLALKTGMRQGELIALRWGDIDLQSAVIRVRRSFTAGSISSPKNHERRDVDLTRDLVELLGSWWGECGRPSGSDVLVFPGEGRQGHLSGSNLLRRYLDPAMARAGIPRVGPTGESRVFHSLRHTYAKRALETGAQITWLSRHLGHSSLKVTSDIYGHWERAERRAQAARLEGVFGV
jgi:integrase